MTERLNQENRFDVLSDVLDTLRFRGSIFFESSIAAPWGFSLAEKSAPRFHIVFSGECYVGANQLEPVKVGAREIVMFAGSGVHWIADQPGRKLISSELADDACELAKAKNKNQDFSNRIMCGAVHFDQESPHPIVHSLPDIVHFKDLENNQSVWGLVSVIEAEILRTKKRTGRIVDGLTELLYLQLLNSYIEEHNDNAGFFGALKDKRIYHALAMIHEDPAFSWSLETLGDQVGMSRATLVRHFKDSVGCAPMNYIANWRLTKAHNLVKYSNTPVEKIASKLGFASAGTFNKAFHRNFGCSPSDLRKSLVSGKPSAVADF